MWNFFEIILHQEMLFKDLSRALAPHLLGRGNHFCNSSRGQYEEHFSKIILNSDQ